MIHVEIESGVEATLGVVRAEGVDSLSRPAVLADAFAETLEMRAGGLAPEEEELRTAVRDMLRHGRYRPTGRAKPASEYLLRAASEGAFPRINAPVDVCNVVSVGSLLPISVWDADRAGSRNYLVRHGMAGESYVFNATGQSIELEDLLLAARVGAPGERGEPVVNPVKDSLAIRTGDASTHVAALIYAPARGFDALLSEAVERFARLVGACGTGVSVHAAILRPPGSVEV
jgi:DNA/RNA-binding domain of Phe-tRNA-synthetase-like protein